MYTTSFEVRQVSGIAEDEISDSVIDCLIDYAEMEIVRQINVRVVDEDLEPNLKGIGIDGNNKTFYTRHCPIADINRDSKVDVNDVTVYVWDNAQDEATKTKVDVSSVTADSGRIVLVTAPSADKERISCDYSYHLNPVDYTLVKRASTYLTAYLALLRMIGKLPISYTLGKALKVDRKDMGKPFYAEYHNLLNMLKSKEDSHVKLPKVMQCKS